MTRRIMTLSLFLLLALGMLAAPLQAKPASSGLDADVLRELAQVRRATAQYHDVTVAEAAGYTVQLDGAGEPDCVSYPGGGMGYHYVNFGLIAENQDGLDPLAPAILVYAPRPNGSLKLVAVEYAAFGSADVTFELLGQGFARPAPPGAGPPFHTLHAWVWKANPDGMFAPFNPNVSC